MSNRSVAAFGPKHLYRAIEQAIVNERYDVAVSLMRTLQDEWTAQADALLPSREDGLMGEKSGSVLIAALDYLRSASATRRPSPWRTWIPA